MWHGCGLGVAWVWHGCGLDVAWMWHGCGLGVAWVWLGCSWVACAGIPAECRNVSSSSVSVLPTHPFLLLSCQLSLPPPPQPNPPPPRSSLSPPSFNYLPLLPSSPSSLSSQEYALGSCPQLIQAVHSLERWLQKKYTRVSGGGYDATGV